MLSESPAVGSVHGHRVGRAAQSRREWTGSAAGPRGHPPASSARPSAAPRPGTRTRLLLRALLRPLPTGPLRGQSCSGLKRRTDVPLCQDRGCSSSGREGSLMVVSPLSTWRKPRKQRWRGIPRGIRGALPAPAQSWRLSVRCDSSFPTCLYFSSSCVVPDFLKKFLFSPRGGGRIPVPCATQDVIVAARLPVSAAPAGSQEQRHKTLCFL